MKKLILFTLTTLVIILVASCLSELLAQCPMCGANVESARRQGSNVGSGLNNGIMYLLAMPYITVGLVSFFAYRRYKQNKKANQENQLP